MLTKFLPPAGNHVDYRNAAQAGFTRVSEWCEYEQAQDRLDAVRASARDAIILTAMTGVAFLASIACLIVGG